MRSLDFLSNSTWIFYDYLIQSQGEEFARKYLQANERAIANIEEICKKYRYKYKLLILWNFCNKISIKYNEKILKIL